MDAKSNPIGTLDEKMISEACQAVEYWTTQQSVEGADQASAILHRLFDEQPSNDCGTNARADAVLTDQLNYSIDSYRIHSGTILDKPRGRMARSADELLARAESNSPQEQSYLTQPDFRSYNMVIDAYAKLGDSSSAEKVLQRMTLRSKIDTSCRPDTVSFNSMLNALSNSAASDAPQRAEEMLQTMQDMNDAGDLDICPDNVSFAAVINTWSRSNQVGAAERAEAILHRMIEISKAGGRRDLKPNAVIYSAVIDAWAKSGEADGARRAESIFELMGKELGDQPGHEDTVALTSAIDALSKSDLSGDGPERAEKMLRATTRTNAVTWTALIDAYARSGRRGSGEKAEALLGEMLHLYEAGNDNVRPTAITFNAVINAISKTGERDAGNKAEAILQRMHSVSFSDKPIRPDPYTYASVIDAWSGSGDRNAGRRGEEILREMDELYRSGDESMRPNLYCYSAALKAWASTSTQDREGGRNAEALLERMEAMYAEGNDEMKPNSVCYGCVLNAHAKVGDAEKAEAFLSKLEDLYERGNEEARPGSIAFSAVVDSWARSRRRMPPSVVKLYLSGWGRLQMPLFPFGHGTQS